MQPSPIADTSKLLFPSLRFFIASPCNSVSLQIGASHDAAWVRCISRQRAGGMPCQVRKARTNARRRGYSDEGKQRFPREGERRSWSKGEQQSERQLEQVHG